MEMTFPHKAVSRDSAEGRKDHKAILAAVIARQANSRTVRAVRRAELGMSAAGDNVDNRIHYFAGHAPNRMAVRGAFWRDIEVKPKAESGVYQAGSMYIKDPDLEGQVATGEYLNLAGQGTMRKL